VKELSCRKEWPCGMVRFEEGSFTPLLSIHTVTSASKRAQNIMEAAINTTLPDLSTSSRYKSNVLNLSYREELVCFFAISSLHRHPWPLLSFALTEMAMGSGKISPIH
jgi:hypothetical protein